MVPVSDEQLVSARCCCGPRGSAGGLVSLLGTSPPVPPCQPSQSRLYSQGSLRTDIAGGSAPTGHCEQRGGRGGLEDDPVGGSPRAREHLRHPEGQGTAPRSSLLAPRLACPSSGLTDCTRAPAEPALPSICLLVAVSPLQVGGLCDFSGLGPDMRPRGGRSAPSLLTATSRAAPPRWAEPRPAVPSRPLVPSLSSS